MSDYYSLFFQNISLFEIIWAGIKFALVGFTLSLVVLIVFKKYILVHRRCKLLQYMARSYYFFIPTICLLCGLICGMTTTARHQITDKLPVYQFLIQSFIQKNFDVDIIIAITKNNNLDNIIDDAFDHIRQELIFKEQLASQNRLHIQRSILILYESPIGSNFIKSSLRNRISSAINLKETMIDEMFEINLSQLLQGDIITKILVSYIQQFVNSILIPIIIIWTILLLLPLIEIIIACRYNNKINKIY